jgi:hypothetical protein
LESYAEHFCKKDKTDQRSTNQVIYTSVADIYKAIDEQRERIYKRVGSVNEEQANTRPNANAWSATEIVEHLTIMEERLVRMIKVMLTKAEGASVKSDRTTVEIKPFSLDQLVARSRNEKYIAPEAMRPSGTVQLADLLVRLRQSRVELRSLRPRIEATDLSAVTYQHPAFGPLNVYQWLAFIGLHEERHLRQLESLIAAEVKL